MYTNSIGGTCNTYGITKKYIDSFILFEESHGNRQFRRPRLKWEDNIKIDIREIRCEGIEFNW
jgi:hypothetical protein